MRLDVIVIGGGASGMFAAGRAAESGAGVLLIERNKRLGSKLLIAGKGRCNITNIAGISDFIENYGKNGRFLYPAFTGFFNKDLIAFFRRYGVGTKVERGGRVFPVTDTSRTILNAIEQYLRKKKVTIKFNSRVTELLLSDCVDSGNRRDQAVIKGVKLESGEVALADKVVLATGGLSYPQTGSTGDGYEMAGKLGHAIIPFRPALVPLETAEDFVGDLQGLSLKNVTAAVLADGRKVASEFGEMLFTHFGVSGPIILRLSALISECLESNEDVSISINFKPALDGPVLTRRLLREFKSSGRKGLGSVMKKLLPRKLVTVFTELSGIPCDKKCSQITLPERKKIITLLTDFRLHVTKTRPIDEAIVTRGGIAIDEINPRTMQSKKVKGLFFCGEVIDIDGKTGGYNLQAAFSTGFLAGMP